MGFSTPAMDLQKDANEPEPYEERLILLRWVAGGTPEAR